MSTHGTCRTPLFEVNVQHVISMDDFGNPPNPNVQYVYAFVRVYRWEFNVTLRKPRGRFYLNRNGFGNIPHLFRFEANRDKYPARHYSGDLTESMHDDPYYGQKPR